jgi:CRP-like cAMP-binding protein
VSANVISTPQNALLATLPAAEWDEARPHFRAVFMPLGDVLYEAGMAVDHIYFPTTSVTSISCVMNDGRADALTLIGREGFVGVELLLGSGSAACRAVVLSEGWAYRITRKLLNEMCERGNAMRSVLLRYALSYITQVAQTTVCNRHHTIDQQLCRWLLMFLDCKTSNDLPLTHAHLSELMGVRRGSVTDAARRLQIAGYIRCRRGHITLVDRAGLEARSCECHEIVKQEAARLLQMSQKTVKHRAILPDLNRVNVRRAEPAAAHASLNFT